MVICAAHHRYADAELVLLALTDGNTCRTHRYACDRGRQDRNACTSLHLTQQTIFMDTFRLNSEGIRSFIHPHGQLAGGVDHRLV